MVTTTNSRMDSRRPADLLATLDEFAVRLEGVIERRACGQIRDLHVDCSADQIVVRGRARTHYAKQLAHEAVLDLTEGRTALANQIVVC